MSGYSQKFNISGSQKMIFFKQQAVISLKFRSEKQHCDFRTKAGIIPLKEIAGGVVHSIFNNLRTALLPIIKLFLLNLQVQTQT